ncbi:hypothetical protein TRVA0_029S00298 [Trichomonascus vanleenenianus]|uniref:uncharacterized protein n=1 Tax=Trichomonascus vanleenenianus TaxID=2268995 RepID=UPI003EC96AFF
MAQVGACFWRHMKAFQVFGANTDVGKTIFTTTICRSLGNRSSPGRVLYVKPVQTGPEEDWDHHHVDRFSKNVTTRCLYNYAHPLSPHIAFEPGKEVPENDSSIVASAYTMLKESAEAKGMEWAFVETAGGPLSPSPSGSLQADVFRALRLPSILVADSKLGGISSTISAYESLTVRGYDVAAVVALENDITQNPSYFATYFKNKCPVITLQVPPSRADDATDKANMEAYYSQASESKEICKLVNHLDSWHQEKMESLSSMSSDAEKLIWYPFSQHTEISKDTITAIDSAHGSFFQTYNPAEKNADGSALVPALDASASWWTQGLGHGNPQLALSAAYAAGRYGHVILANTIHKPALDLAKKVLKMVDNPRLSRVFYSDNGSTGIEVAIKMALKASCDRYGWNVSDKNIGVIGLKRSYHGDTIGAMDCTEPSVYSEKVTWYDDRGFWFDYPTFSMKNGKWTVEVPEDLKPELGEEDTIFESIGEIFDLEKRDASRYESYIKQTISERVTKGEKFGAIMLEPIILGAGGMVSVDPLFQRSLVNVARQNPGLFGRSHEDASKTTWSGLPVIFDEVFTGLYRLGYPSAASFLGDAKPDISVHAKLLTGGLVPLCVTLASESIFKTFLSSEKSDALLHGHSYTAHPVGCKVALDSLNQYEALDADKAWGEWKSSWGVSSQNSYQKPWSVWSPDFLSSISTNPGVNHALAMGSILAINLKDTQGGGYTSKASAALASELAQPTKEDIPWKIHLRVLGNVIYIMSGQLVTKEEIELIQTRVLNAIEKSL